MRFRFMVFTPKIRRPRPSSQSGVTCSFPPSPVPIPIPNPGFGQQRESCIIYLLYISFPSIEGTFSALRGFVSGLQFEAKANKPVRHFEPFRHVYHLSSGQLDCFPQIRVTAIGRNHHRSGPSTVFFMPESHRGLSAIQNRVEDTVEGVAGFDDWRKSFTPRGQVPPHCTIKLS